MKWSELSMTEKNEVIKMAVAQGIKDISSIKNLYEESINRSRRFEDGGGMKITPRTTGGAGYIPSAQNQQFINKLLVKAASIPMRIGAAITDNPYISNPAADTYLVSRDAQAKYFESLGYKKVKDDYGLVKKAVGNRDIPVFQRTEDDIDRSSLIPIGNTYTGDNDYYGKQGTEIPEGASYPTAVYMSTNGDIYQKAWDLNDYGDSAGGNGNKYPYLLQKAANLIDKIGNPTVITTGYKRAIGYGDTPLSIGNITSEYYRMGKPFVEMRDNWLKQNGLHMDYVDENSKAQSVPMLSEIIVTGKKHKYGGPIHIAPSKRGTFTASASKHGMGVQEFASKVLSHPENYSLTMRKKANFARNASKWKH